MWVGDQIQRRKRQTLSQDWSQIWGYTFPPFSLVGRCLSQVQEQDTQYLCLVAPVWETPPWYPLLLHLSVDFPRLFPTDPRVLIKEGSRHLLPKLELARVICLSQYYTAMGISNQAQGLLVSACDNQTSSSYESAWRLWGSWCSQQEVDPFPASV